MRDEHIINMLENAPLADLSESELASIRAHTKLCAECRQAFAAAQVSALLIRERVAETFEPSPFFQTRVLAALRERQATNEVSVFKRIWKATGALVTSMAATVAALAVLTFVVPEIQTTVSQEVATAASSYTEDEVLLSREELTEDEMSYEQVLATLYESEEGAVK
jgi:hypothetical protein